jgi:hypothetical protein
MFASPHEKVARNLAERQVRDRSPISTPLLIESQGSIGSTWER